MLLDTGQQTAVNSVGGMKAYGNTEPWTDQKAQISWARFSPVGNKRTTIEFQQQVTRQEKRRCKRQRAGEGRPRVRWRLKSAAMASEPHWTRHGPTTNAAALELETSRYPKT